MEEKYFELDSKKLNLILNSHFNDGVSIFSCMIQHENGFAYPLKYNSDTKVFTINDKEV